MVVLHIGLWADETSGNRSKRFNLFETWQCHLANVPRAFNMRESNVRFICAAKGVSCLEIAEAIVDDVTETLERGFLWTDPNGNKIVITGTVAYLMGDGPKLSIFASHRGSLCRWFCRICDHDAKDSTCDVGAFGTLRTPESTLALIAEMQVQLLAPDQAKGVAEGPNPLFRLRHLDVHLDTVTDALHWGPLGFIKHATKLLFRGLKKGSDFEKRVIDFIDGLPTSSFPRKIRGLAVVRHNGSFVGSDFKFVAQIDPFIARAVATQSNAEVLPLFVAASALHKLLYQAVAVAKDQKHRQQLIDACNQVLYCFKSHPELSAFSRMRFKCHLNTHVALHADSYVIYIPFSCETFEATNGTARNYLFNTNRQHPSYDIALAFALKFVADFVAHGECWLDKDAKPCWIGPDLLRVFQEPEARVVFGGGEEQEAKPAGTCKLASLFGGLFVFRKAAGILNLCTLQATFTGSSTTIATRATRPPPQNWPCTSSLPSMINLSVSHGFGKRGVGFSGSIASTTLPRLQVRLSKNRLA